MKRYSWLLLLQHLLLFLIVEIIFVLVIFRELPETNLLTLMGVLHTSYRCVLVLAWWLRIHYAYRVWQKFLCTYIPVVYHVVTHVAASLIILEEMSDHGEHHSNPDILRLWIGTFSAWMLIALGEYWLHRTTHCDTHHAIAHKHCHDEDCEQDHDSH